MKVAFNARLLHAPTLRGWNRYTVNLLAELPSLGISLFLYTDKALHKSHLARLPKDSYSIRIAPKMRYALWEQCWLPQQCAADEVDLLHSPFNFGLPWSSVCPRVLTLHDAIDQVYYRNGATWKDKLNLHALRGRLYPWIARTRAHHIITDSEHSKSDLVEHLRIPAEKITVIHDAAGSIFHEVVLPIERCRVRRQHQLAQSYVFYVGGWEKRKNIQFLLKAFAAAKLCQTELVLAGGQDYERAELSRLADGLGIANQVRMLDWVEDIDLPALYEEALCFVYPSEYEGFGLQLCEAMAAGCPTLAARATSLPEVLSGGGETFSLSNMDELTALLKRVAFDPRYRVELASRAKGRAADFSWHLTAEQTVSVYQRVMGVQ
jgi:glycosyltransferase involved in cell wall biosynthesis